MVRLCRVLLSNLVVIRLTAMCPDCSFAALSLRFEVSSHPSIITNNQPQDRSLSAPHTIKSWLLVSIPISVQRKSTKR